MATKIKIIFSFCCVGILFFLGGCGCKTNNAGNVPMKLEVWSLFDDKDAFAQIFENYKKLHPNITDIVYKKFTPDTYQKELLDALAAGQGPDIFIINNTWLPGFKDKLAPAPVEVLNEAKFRKDFVDVAANDFLADGSPYAVPLSVDSLGLYYNKDLFNAAGISSPPTDWNTFVDDVKRLTRIDEFGNITQAGVAMGTAYNINRSTDVLNLFMMQNNMTMIDRTTKRAVFDELIKVGDNNVFPGENTLNFYTQFARRGSPVYSWNSSLHYSIDAFSEGTVGMMFNYSWQIDTIIKKAPKLNFAIAPVPQFPGAALANFANYWGYAVYKNKITQPDPNNPKAAVVTNDVRTLEAWKFLKFLATKPEGDINITANVAGSKKVVDPNYDPAVDYVQKTGKPMARRDLIEIQKNDAKVGVFSAGNLVAKSWYEIDPNSIENIFADMITQVNNGSMTTADAIKAATARVTQLMN
jgi:ABC-type glycerol-3-phosphate transport system substrate-binding protein